MKASQIRHFLVVDDEDSFRKLVGHYIQKLGFRCEMASNAVEALRKIESAHFDIVVSDIRMKEKDGLELMRETRSKFPDLDFIIMTAHAGDYSYSDIVEAGAADFITKPFPLPELKAKIERITREKQLVTRLRMANEELQIEIAERRQVEEELLKAKNALQTLLDERTAKLSKAGEILKRGIDNFRAITESDGTEENSSPGLD